MMGSTNIKQIYFWKFSLILLGVIVLTASFMKSPGFITSYIVDICGPAWIYILIRVQYSAKRSDFLSMKFSPELAAIFIIGIGFIIETSQYFNLTQHTLIHMIMWHIFQGSYRSIFWINGLQKDKRAEMEVLSQPYSLKLVSKVTFWLETSTKIKPVHSVSIDA